MYALVQGNQVIKYQNINLNDVPEHKRSYFRPVVDEKPALADAQYLSSSPEIIVQPDAVIRRWSALELDRTALIDLIKAEAQRRIIALTGASDLMTTMVKQSNANMRANELNDRRLRGETISPAEEAEAAALRGLADQIKTIRRKSNEIEAMDPIPIDFRSDFYWS